MTLLWGAWSSVRGGRSNPQVTLDDSSKFSVAVSEFLYSMITW